MMRAVAAAGRDGMPLGKGRGQSQVAIIIGQSGAESTLDEARFGELLRAYRERLLLSQEQLAERSGLSTRTIRDLELGRVRRPHAVSVRLLVDALELRGPERLLFEQTVRNGATARHDDGPATAHAVMLPGAVPSQLPPDIADFTGRALQVRKLVELFAVRDAGRRPAAVVVSMITGKPGVGKTTLAVHAAHRLAARFPDGQLFADLLGGGPQPAAAGEMLGMFLRALGQAPDDVPDSVEERAARYRTMLAGRRMLIVLDNARDAAQVRPLLPGSQTCGVLVTSRQRLTGIPGARPLELVVLERAEAMALLGRLIGDARVAAEPEAADDVVRACGGLPLAVRIAGARLAARLGWTVRTLADRLADQHRRLDELETGDLAVRASFQVSYARQDAEHRRAFRLVGLVEGPDIGLLGAAALLDRSPELTSRVMEDLVDVHLMESPAPERYRMHDLLRLFATEQAIEEEPAERRDAALARLLDFSIAAAHHADELVRPGRIRAKPARVPDVPVVFDGDAAAAWLEAERLGMLALVRQAAGGRAAIAERAGQLLESIHGFLDMRGYWSDLERAALAVLEAATYHGDRRTESGARRVLGQVAWRRYRLDDAVGHLQRGLELCRQVADLGAEEAYFLSTLGNVHCARGEYEQAIACYQRELALLDDGGDASVAVTWGNLGVAYLGLSRQEDAIACWTRVLEIHRATGDRTGEAIDLNNLGDSYHQLARYREAIDLQRRSIEICQAIGNRNSERHALIDLARTYRAVGRADRAASCCDQALSIVRELGEPHGEGIALWELGNARWDLGQYAAASSCWRDALALLEAIRAPEAAEVRTLLAR
jgi:tetratricopeptide (TPR) repeat protein/transcriptional regulator with XRE-family HTH domain